MLYRISLGFLLLLMAVLLPAQSLPEITRGDYTVRLTPQGPEMRWRGVLLSANSRPSLVIGPGWQRVLLGDLFWKEAEVTQEENRILAHVKGEDFQAEVSFAVSEQGIETALEFHTQATPVDDASFWFMAFPQELCGGALFSQEDPGILMLMPPVASRELLPQSRWRITRDSQRFTLYTSLGTLRVEGSAPFYVFDGRYHGHFPPNCRTISLSTGGFLKSGIRHLFRISMEDAQKVGSLRFSPVPLLPLGTGQGETPWESPLLLAGSTHHHLSFQASSQENRLLFAFCKDTPPAPEDRLEVHLRTEDGGWYKRLILHPQGEFQLEQVDGKALYELTPKEVEYAVEKTSSGAWSARLALPMDVLGLTREDLPRRSARILWRTSGETLSYPPMRSEGTCPFAFFFFPHGAPDSLEASTEYELPAGENWMVLQGENRSSQPCSVLAQSRIAPDSQATATTGASDYQTAQVTGPTITDGKGRLSPPLPLVLPPQTTGLFLLPMEILPEDSQIQPLLLTPQGEGVASSHPYFRSSLSYHAELSRVPERLTAWPEGCSAQEKEALAQQAQALDQRLQEAQNPQERKAAQEACARFLSSMEKRELCLAQGRQEALGRQWDYQIFSSLERLHPAALQKEHPLGGELSFTLAGDETGNAQIALLPLENTPKTLPLTLQPLCSSEGKPLPGAQVTVFQEEEVLASGTPLLDRLNPVSQVTLSGEENQLILWVRLTVPPQTPPGEYQGSLELGEVSLPLKATILPWNLPRADHVFALCGYGVEEFSQREEADRFARMLMDYDLYPQRGNAWPSFMDSELEGDHFGLDSLSRELLSRFGRLTVATFPWLGWLTDHYQNGRFQGNPAGYYAAASQKVGEAVQTLRQEGNQKPLYVYYDEIGAKEDVVKEMLEALKQKWNVRVCSAFCAPHLGRERIQYYEDLVDLFYFNDGHFVREDLLQYIQELKAKGKEIGWYFNLSYPRFPTSNMINASGVAKRIQFFCQWKYGIHISLYWGANCWQLFNGHDWTTRPLSTSGDGILFYPEKESGFVPSLRAELLREGAQDYRALLYLQHLYRQAKERNVALNPEFARQVEEMLAVTWITSVVDYPEEPNVLLTQRQRINRAITRLHHLLK